MTDKPTDFDDYFQTVYSFSNDFSEKEYKSAAAVYEHNYGKFLQDKKATILDLGCGCGHFLYFLKHAGYENFSAIDISKSQVDYCKDKIDKRVECVDGFKHLEENKAFYDVIVLNDVLEHIPKDKIAFFAGLIFASLRVGGRVLVTTPNLGNPYSVACRYCDITHTIGLTEKSFRQLFLGAGFVEVDSYPCFIPGLANNIVRNILLWFLRKKMFYQGISASKVLTHNLIGVAKKR